MSVLTANQLADLQAYIKTSIRKYEPLQEELLDHLACLVEEKIADGFDYEVAKILALDNLNKDEVKKTEGRALYFIHTKPVLMKFFMFLGMSSLLIMLLGPISNRLDADSAKQEQLIDSAIALPSKDIPMSAVTAESKQFSTGVITVPHIVSAAKQNDPPEIAPLDQAFKVISNFGPRMHPVLKKVKHHFGVDFRAPMGTPIVSTADGTIELAKSQEGYGLSIIIQHDEQYKSVYAHLSEIKVKPGQQVKKGTVIGLVGNSGLSKAPHLHYEVLKNGKRVNPLDYIPQS